MKLLLYCTKAKPYIMKYKDGKYKEIASFYNKQDLATYGLLNGKIVAECDFEVEDLRIVDDDPLGAYWYETKTLSENEVLEKSCLTGDELFDYLGEDNEGYAIHIKNLHIFDNPKELNEFRKGKWIERKEGPVYWIEEEIKKAPSNMIYVVDEKGNDCILLTVMHEPLCEILNGHQTIIIKKNVLKEMKR